MIWEANLLWRKRLQRAFPLIIAALAFTVIAPTLWSGWLSDDAY